MARPTSERLRRKSEWEVFLLAGGLRRLGGEVMGDPVMVGDGGEEVMGIEEGLLSSAGWLYGGMRWMRMGGGGGECVCLLAPSLK